MHSAPAVSFPTGRSRFLGCLIGTMAICGWLTVCFWIYSADDFAWPQWLALGLCLVVSLSLGMQWLEKSNGILSWNGSTWFWTDGAISVMVLPELVLDFQRVMLLRLRVTTARRVVWIWLDHAISPVRWMALRRAVHHLVKHNQLPLTDAVSTRRFH